MSSRESNRKNPEKPRNPWRIPAWILPVDRQRLHKMVRWGLIVTCTWFRFCKPFSHGSHAAAGPPGGTGPGPPHSGSASRFFHPVVGKDLCLAAHNPPDNLFCNKFCEIRRETAARFAVVFRLRNRMYGIFLEIGAGDIRVNDR